jgi:hypothetical protein
VCSLNDLSPRPREEWLKLARKLEDALIGQSDLLDADDGEVADIVRRMGARRAGDRDHDVISSLLGERIDKLSHELASRRGHLPALGNGII